MIDGWSDRSMMMLFHGPLFEGGKDKKKKGKKVKRHPNQTKKPRSTIQSVEAELLLLISLSQSSGMIPRMKT